MKLYEINDHTNLYLINTVEKFDAIAKELLVAARIMQDHKVLNDMPIQEYVNILRKQIETKYDKFRLLVSMDTEEKKLTGSIAAFIAIDDNQKPACLLYGAYFFPKALKVVLPWMIIYFDVWAKPYGCNEMLFSTSRRNPEAYERLLKRWEFKPTHTVFRRKINALGTK